MELNKNWKRRNEILELPETDNFHNFKNVTIEQLTKLKDENFLNLEDRHNSAPSIEEFIDLLSIYDGSVTFMGYAVNSTRDDYRVSIDGFKINVDFGMLKYILVNFSCYSSIDINGNDVTLWWD